MKRALWTLLAALSCAACADGDERGDAAMPPLVDDCLGLPALTLVVSPAKLRVSQVAMLRASGGSGRFTYAVDAGGSGGEVRGDRFVAGATPALDHIVASDDCGNSARAEVEVQAAFFVAPARATVRPGTSFQLRVSGMLGAPEFRAQSLGSLGSVSPTGLYTAGAAGGIDLIVVRDAGSGEEALVQYRVAASAQFRASPAHVALPAGASLKLETVDGSDTQIWTKQSGPGSLAGDMFSAEVQASGIAMLEALDSFTNERTSVVVHVLDELMRPTKAHGRLTDVANIATGDFDGDGLRDVALGVPESNLARPSGGAVFVFKGAVSGLPAQPTYVLEGDSDTGNFGAVLAAGDLDGDGRDDLAISEPGADVTIADSGAVLLYRFTDQGPEPLRATLTGLGRGNFGGSLAVADVDGDGDSDLLVGSPGGDLARSAQIDARGVIDVFLMQKGSAIADTGMLRIGGSDLAADGTVRATRDLRFGRGLAVADFNGDGRADLASLGSVKNSLVGGNAQARSQVAVVLHFGRQSSPIFGERPDLYILPSDGADGSEGTWRLTVAPGKTARLALSADQLDSPDLTSSGGVKSGGNAGALYLYDLSGRAAPEAPPERPVQLGRGDAFARIWGDVPNGNAGRGVAFADVDGDGSVELVLGAPYADHNPSPTMAAANLRMAGRLLVYPYSSLSAGAQLNKPSAVRGGSAKSDALGVAVAPYSPDGKVSGLLAYAARASTPLGDFTGRLEAYLGKGALATLPATQADIPARAAAERHGSAVAVGVIDGRVHALVGVPGYSGAGVNGDGNDVGAGQSLLYRSDQPAMPRLVHEGAERPYTSNNRPAFGGRSVGGDVALSDFDGDGRLDYVTSVPQLATPVANNTEYAALKPECVTSSAQSNGGALVHLARPDGSFAEGFRVFAPSAIAGCTPADSAACKRSGIGRDGLAGGFDFDGDGKQDLLLTRSNGLEVFLGRAPDDLSLSRPSMACNPLFSLPALAQGVSAPAPLRDLDGDGCDELSVRYSDGTRSGVLIAFGYAVDGTRCAGHKEPAWLRISGDGEVGLNNMQLGIATTFAGKVLADARDFVAISAALFPFEGVAQPTVLLIDVAQLVAKRPPRGEAVVSVLNAGLTPIPIVYRERAPGFGRSLAGNADLDGDGQVDLLVAAPGASLNGDGAGAVFAFRGSAQLIGRSEPWLTVFGDGSERAAIGQDLSVVQTVAGAPTTVAIGAPLSYRTGTANGTTWLLTLGR